MFYICITINNNTIMTKKKEVIIPQIVTNVINGCDDLINQAMGREYDRFINLKNSYQNWLLKFEPDHKFRYGSIVSFLQYITNRFKVGGSVEYQSLSYSHINKNEFNQELFDKWFSRYKEEYKVNQTWKLIQSMMKHLTDNDKLVSDIRISKTAKGFCVEFQYSNDKGLFNYQTDAIDAGGHNIQCYHYRYITKIKQVII